MRKLYSSAKANRWCRFTSKPYAVFRSVRREVSIGVLTVSALTAFPATMSADEADDTPTTTVGLQEVQVMASRVAMSERQTPRIVKVIRREEIAAAPVTTVNDLLKYAAGVDVRQRGEMGVQTDISLRGGTFDQVTVLLNGININNPQSGHLTADFPVNLSDIERIEILSGPASRICGSSAFSGAINIVTTRPQSSRLTAEVEGGQYGLFKGELGGTLRTNPYLTNTLSAAYYRSDGATQNSDFQGMRAYYAGNYERNRITAQVQLGMTDKGFGANTFYSPKYDNQYEHVSRYYASGRFATSGRLATDTRLYFHRTQDRFELFRDNAASWYTGPNLHRTDVQGLTTNLTYTSTAGKSALGAEVRREEVVSNVLGTPISSNHGDYTNGDHRTEVDIFAEHNLTAGPLTLSAGVMMGYNTALSGVRFFPGIDASVRLTSDLQLSAGWNRSLRMPTFTDLYYKSATNIGNPDLKPEKNEMFEVSLRYASSALRTSLTGFYQKGTDMIDWIKPTSDEDKWQTVNHTQLNNMGVEWSGLLDFATLVRRDFFIRSLQADYAYIYQDKKIGEVYKSNYALEYLRHKFTARLTHTLGLPELTATWAVRWQKRMGTYTRYENLTAVGEVPYKAYATLDLRIQWAKPRYRIFAEATNLTDCRYVDLGNIPQPGIWVKGGVAVKLGK
jgi:iron complex outermembrane receptor protein